MNHKKNSSAKKISTLTGMLMWCLMTLVHSMPRDKTPSDFPEANARIGQSFIFREADESIAKYGYMDISKNKKRTYGDKLSYEEYKGKKGKVIGIIAIPLTRFSETYLWHLELEGGEIVYARWSPVLSDQINDLVFQSDLDEAQKVIGEKIWLNWTQPGIKKGLISSSKDVIRHVSHLEEVQVVGIDTMRYGHGTGAAPFWLRVKFGDGQEALLGYSQRNFYAQNPIKSAWDKKTIESIKQKKVFIGMTAEQLILSWGKPEKVNRTITKNVTHEQWIYGNQYVYVENDKVTAIQESAGQVRRRY
ncbi:MAG: hypothetical protein NUV55_04620 [Sulfuricaulis sp.]|uniref:hypothetical protein n=1 Tax=Sulfuricaulis sp. TaxID=2003553 RepID=UPI0025DD9879|nr:hypothetical protein [Sulfuricaulis sp.]MCR4346477.1 hypothetical protein [Sulfuricaulis sp.]